MYQSTEIVSKNLASEIIPFLTFAPLPFWALGWPVKLKRLDLRELNSAANIDFYLRTGMSEIEICPPFAPLNLAE